MPDITDSELRQFVRYQGFGTPDEVQKKISELEKDNKESRDKVKNLTEKLPKDDQVVVAKEDAELLPKFKELGKPDDLKAKIDEGEKAKTKLADVERKTSASQFAKVAGLADEAVDTLIAIPALEGATLEVKKSKVKNDKGVEVEQEVGYITLAGENQKALSFTEAQEQVPALKGLRTASPTEDKSEPRKFVQQNGNVNVEAKNVYDKIRAEKEEKFKAQEKTKVRSLEDRLGMAPNV